MPAGSAFLPARYAAKLDGDIMQIPCASHLLELIMSFMVLQWSMLSACCPCCEAADIQSMWVLSLGNIGW